MKKPGAGRGYVIGVDEVGRGCLAGPVVVAAARIAPASRMPLRDPAGKSLKDSKKLTPIQREWWYQQFVADPMIEFAVARVSPRQIEKRNIAKAANLAAQRAFRRLATSQGAATNSGPSDSKIFLDGGLYLGTKKWQAAYAPKAKTMVRADERITAVKIASIVAKVQRDRLMRRLAKKFPGYGFEVHKGYGTRAHYAALKVYGPCDLHRLTFLS